MKQLAYLTLVMELIVVGVAAWEVLTPGCGGQIDRSAIHADGVWCGPIPVLIVTLGSLLTTVTIGYIIALNINQHAFLLRKLFAALNFAASIFVAIILVATALSSVAMVLPDLSESFRIITALMLALLFFVALTSTGGALLGKLNHVKIQIVWLGTICSIGLVLLVAYIVIEYVFFSPNSYGPDPTLEVTSLGLLTIVLGFSTYLLAKANIVAFIASDPLRFTHSKRNYFVRSVFVVCLIATGACLLILEFPAKWKHFPDISDWDSLRITLEREGCLGRCPIYRVEIRGDGTVLYDGALFVTVEGHQRVSISPVVVRQLFKKFRAANFFAFSNNYSIIGFDVPAYTTSIEFDGRFKSVYNFDGPRVGMPHVVTELEDAIDQAANTGRWINGS